MLSFLDICEGRYHRVLEELASVKEDLRRSEAREVWVRGLLEGTEIVLGEYVGLFHESQKECSRLSREVEELRRDSYIPPQW